MKKYIGYRGIAEICGIAYSTVTSYQDIGRLPAPDVLVDGRPGWLPATIIRWNDSRPGHGGRPPKPKE